MSEQLKHAKLEDINSLLESQEKIVRGLRPGTEKKVSWAQGNGIKSKTSIVFIHGFSASRVEIDPVVDLIAAELSANVYFTRLRGHGQDGRALAEATYEHFLDDTTEAIKIGKLIGDDVVLIGCSTGCSLIHIALGQYKNIKAAIYISPNFGPKPIKGHALRVRRKKLRRRYCNER